MDPREFQYVFFGLLIVFVVIAAYAVSLGLRERRLRNELERVRRMAQGQ